MPSNRQPKGTPVGGQFAPGAKPSPVGVRLVEEPAWSEAAQADFATMDEVALILALAKQWSHGDELTDIAEVLTRAGRPDPGVEDAEEYDEAWGAYIAGRDVEDNPSTHGLDTLGKVLAANEWDADMLQEAAAIVEQSGRPHPGDRASGRAYRAALRASALRDGRRKLDDLDWVQAELARDDRVMALAAVDEIAARPGVTPAHFAGADDAFRGELDADLEEAAGQIAEYVNDTDWPSFTPRRTAREHLLAILKEAAEDEDEEEASGLECAGAVVTHLYDAGRLTDKGVYQLGAGAAGLIAEEYLEPVIAKYEERLVSGK